MHPSCEPCPPPPPQKWTNSLKKEIKKNAQIQNPLLEAVSGLQEHRKKIALKDFHASRHAYLIVNGGISKISSAPFTCLLLKPSTRHLNQLQTTASLFFASKALACRLLF